MRLAIVAIAIMLAWLTYLFVEKPIRFGKPSDGKVVVLLVLMIVAGYAGYDCFKRDGFGSRFPAIVQELLEYKRTRFDGWGKASCSLSQTQDYTAFKHCLWREEQDKKPLLLLWGDSNAEHLYPGYKSSFGGEYQIAMRTASLCPPILDMDIVIRPHCRKINDYVFESVRKQRPDKVVLAGIWNEYDWKQLEGTIDRLRQIGITDIDLIGPAPRWTDNLPRLLFLKFRSDVFRQVPVRMGFGLRPDVLQLDPVLSGFARRLKIDYISPVSILCDADGCITRLGETGDTLMAYDHVHLTTKGSEFLVSRFPRN
jgi:hypothetical protein